MAEETSKKPLLGLTANRIRGLLALLVLLGLVYFTIFESEPPPAFTEVVIEIPPAPEDVEFDEKSIMLPEFKPSPTQGEAETDREGLEIIPAVSQKKDKPEPTAEGQQASVTDSASASASEVKVEPAAPVASAPPGYYVQVAALSTTEKADELAKQLEQMLNEPTYIFEVVRQGQSLHRVRLGPYPGDEGKANEVMNRLRERDPKLGIHAHVDEE